MRRFGKWLGRILLALVLIGCGMWLFGPYEDGSLETSFGPRNFDGGVQAYFDSVEAQFDDITPGVEKQVIWHGAAETPTEWVVLYLHGFSGTSQEIRPVPDMLARALGANLVLTRMAGHGRGEVALGQATVPEWMADVAEGLAVARAVGKRVLVLGTSMGGTLAAAVAVDPELSKNAEAVVMIAPNFRLKHRFAGALSWPAARYWFPLMVGETQNFGGISEAHLTYWTTRYPTVASMPLAALIKSVAALDLSKASVPALFIYSDLDTVVDSAATDVAMAAWGGPTTRYAPVLGEGDDKGGHVIAGDIRSPNQTAPVAEQIIKWALEL